MSPSSPDTPFPRRGHLLLAAVAFTLIAVYGSLVPLTYRAVAWEDAVEQFRQIPFLDIGIKSRADWVANILLFVPLGWCWSGVLLLDLRGAWKRLLFAPAVGALVIVTLLALAVSLEFTQIWFPPRTVSQNDIQAETIGGAVGTALWLLLGQSVVDWCRGWTAHWRARRPLDFFLALYLIGLLIYSVMPLDLTIHPSELYHKLEKGRLELIPFTHGSIHSTGFWWHRGTDLLVFIPVGWWAAHVATRAGAGPRTVAKATLIGGLLVVMIEIGQIFIYSRFTSTTEVLFGTAGVAVGAWTARRLARQKTASQTGERRQGLAGLLFGAAVLVYSAALCVLFWWPMELLRDSELAERRLMHFFSIPFSSLYRGTEFNALTEITRKSLLFGVLGLLWVGLIRNLAATRRGRRAGYLFAWLYAVALSTAIEAVQAVFPPHVTDVTDVLIASAGMAAGLYVGTQLLPPRGTPSAAT